MLVARKGEWSEKFIGILTQRRGRLLASLGMTELPFSRSEPRPPRERPKCPISPGASGQPEMWSPPLAWRFRLKRQGTRGGRLRMVLLAACPIPI